MSAEREEKISELAQAMLDACAAWTTSTLADLYEPDLMPPKLRKAYQTLDLAVYNFIVKHPLHQSVNGWTIGWSL